MRRIGLAVARAFGRRGRDRGPRRGAGEGMV